MVPRPHRNPNYLLLNETGWAFPGPIVFLPYDVIVSFIIAYYVYKFFGGLVRKAIGMVGGKRLVTKGESASLQADDAAAFA